MNNTIMIDGVEYVKSTAQLEKERIDNAYTNINNVIDYFCGRYMGKLTKAQVGTMLASQLLADRSIIPHIADVLMYDKNNLSIISFEGKVVMVCTLNQVVEGLGTNKNRLAQRCAYSDIPIVDMLGKNWYHVDELIKVALTSKGVK